LPRAIRAEASKFGIYLTSDLTADFDASDCRFSEIDASIAQEDLGSHNNISKTISVNQRSPIPAFHPILATGMKSKHHSRTGHSREIHDKAALSALEDKRQRNNAASARFRIKKKQHEEALRHNIKGLTDRNAVLESYVSSLKRQNEHLMKIVRNTGTWGDDIKYLPTISCSTASPWGEADPVVRSPHISSPCLGN
jgi:Basic region leucine zipper